MDRAALLAGLPLLVPLPTLAAAPEHAQLRTQWRSAEVAAERYARRREGRVSFALVDDTGKLRAHGGSRTYSSASVVKAMLLVAYLNRPEVRGRRLPAAVRVLLRPMIVRSDNGAAGSVYSLVGPDGLHRLARRARMTRFSAGARWSNSRITAADQARLFARVDRLVPERHRPYARRLLRDVVPSQRWGIPRALPPGSRAYIKGGWRPEEGGWLVHQVALVEGGRRRVSLAVLTDGDRSERYGHETIRGVAVRLLRPLAEG